MKWTGWKLVWASSEPRWESGAGLTRKISEGDSTAGSRLLRFSPLIWCPNSGRRFPHFFGSPSPRPLPPSTSPSSSSSAGKTSTAPFPFLLCSLPASPRLPFLPGNQLSSARPPWGKATARGGRPLPRRRAQRGAAAPRAPAFPYLTWTNACRQSQEFRPLTSASSSQGTARETEGRGWGRWGGRRGKGTNQQPLQPCRSFTFCLWVRSRAPCELSWDK